tara:strand:- start:30 stop:758 length:729 start_codon:yes stop_codon:yes gene_type:complete
MDEYECMLKYFDEAGKEDIRAQYDKLKKDKEEQDKTYAGRLRIKKELNRIKEECPAKCLKILMEVANEVNEMKELIDDLKDNDELLVKVNKLDDLIASADNNNNIFNCITELMAVCDESEITKNVKYSNEQLNKQIKERLTEAQILSRALDPKNLKYTQCKKCMRCMTTSHYKRNHQGTKVCKTITNTKIATLHSKTFYNSSQSETLIKVTARTRKAFNEVSDDIDWGEHPQMKIPKPKKDD